MSEIPYTVERRADTGVTNVTMGIWLVLASEVMLFGALFSAYALLRVSAVSWPHGPDVLSLPRGLTSTALLLLMTMTIWRTRSRAGAQGRRLLALSSFIAFLFLVNKGMEYRDEVAHGLLPSTSTFFAMYFTLTGLHALHVVCGLVANLWAAAGVGRVSDAMTAGRTRALSLYWSFVDIVWLIILVLLYLS
jgi:heme/copper-type cytochrome/quinol oxidase subunit 3